jgi:signal peptidase II
MPDNEEGMAFGAKLGLIVSIVAGLLVVDLATKIIAERTLDGQPGMRLLGDTIRIAYVRNPGVFLSLGHSLSPGMRFWLFVVGVGAVLVMLLALTLRDARFRRVEVIAVAAIVGGGVGNLIDRVLYGSVRDFMNVGIGPLRTGIFNVADMAITFGGIALIVLPLLRRKG